MRGRFRFIKHIFWAVIWLVGLVCCAEVGWRIYTVSEGTLVAESDIPLLPSFQTHHQLEPLGVLPATDSESKVAAPIELNSLGLRGPEPSLNRVPGSLRVVCLGDDLTFGAGLADEELFSARLQEMLSKALRAPVEVINAGVPDYCPLLSYLQYKHQLSAYVPDVILVTFDMSDVADDHAVRSFTRLDADGLPLACRHPGLAAASKTKTLEEHFLTLKWLKCELKDWRSTSNYAGFEDIDHAAGRYAWLRESPPEWTPYIRNALEPIGQLQELTRPREPLVILSVIPAPWQVSANAASDPDLRRKHGIALNVRYTNRQPFEALRQFAESAEIPFLDVSQIFVQAGNPEDLYQHKTPWMSSRGHEMYASLLAGYLLPRLGLPPTSQPTERVVPASHQRQK